MQIWISTSELSLNCTTYKQNNEGTLNACTAFIIFIELHWRELVKQVIRKMYRSPGCGVVKRWFVVFWGDQPCQLRYPITSLLDDGGRHSLRNVGCLLRTDTTYLPTVLLCSQSPWIHHIIHKKDCEIDVDIHTHSIVFTYFITYRTSGCVFFIWDDSSLRCHGIHYVSQQLKGIFRTFYES